MPADKTQAKQGVVKIPKQIPVPLWDIPARNQAAHSRKQQAAGPHILH